MLFCARNTILCLPSMEAGKDWWPTNTRNHPPLPRPKPTHEITIFEPPLGLHGPPLLIMRMCPAVNWILLAPCPHMAAGPMGACMQTQKLLPQPDVCIGWRSNSLTDILNRCNSTAHRMPRPNGLAAKYLGPKGWFGVAGFAHARTHACAVTPAYQTTTC